jgi:hypothetical protein
MPLVEATVFDQHDASHERDPGDMDRTCHIIGADPPPDMKSRRPTGRQLTIAFSVYERQREPARADTKRMVEGSVKIATPMNATRFSNGQASVSDDFSDAQNGRRSALADCTKLITLF